MNFSDIEARAYLREISEYPENIRTLFLYVICETMLRQGLLELLGAFREESGTVVLYLNTNTGTVFEVAKPEMSVDEEQAIRAHIDDLLTASAQAS